MQFRGSGQAVRSEQVSIQEGERDVGRGFREVVPIGPWNHISNARWVADLIKFQTQSVEFCLSHVNHARVSKYTLDFRDMFLEAAPSVAWAEVSLHEAVGKQGITNVFRLYPCPGCLCVGFAHTLHHSQG